MFISVFAASAKSMATILEKPACPPPGVRMLRARLVAAGLMQSR